HTYTVQLFPPSDSGIKSPKTKASAVVRVSDEESLRVLYLQGGLTWDYKFIRLALENDPSIQLTGLSRTGSQSRFFQNLEQEAPLLEGFPETLEELSPFRVVVLANLKPSDLTPPQQSLLSRYCSEYGGGVLMVGGSGTFNASWVNSPLEQLLPVRFSPNTFRNRQAGPFRLKLTPAAENSPLFQISQEGDNQTAWANTPLFTEYATVENTKAGAQVWIEHPRSFAGRQPDPLLITQQFGSGVSGVFCVQNLWRWRLAKQSNTDHYDRFWRQLFRHLAGGAREPIVVHIKDQVLEPNVDIQLVVERRPNPNPSENDTGNYRLRVMDEKQQLLTEEPLILKPGQSRELSFHPKTAGFYTVTVLDRNDVPLAQRSVEIQEIAKEFLQTACNMDNLKQWANLSGGLAIKAEDCQNFGEVLAQWNEETSDTPQPPRLVKPAGINGWMMAALVGCFCAEWILRKRWGLF
ncbi:MAG: hypothetical protein KDA84_28730, partial [Planctomycetaceae bacterium]|nr:hypothetical protein [Planctomycetaceae bacterium]